MKHSDRVQDSKEGFWDEYGACFIFLAWSVRLTFAYVAGGSLYIGDGDPTSSILVVV